MVFNNRKNCTCKQNVDKSKCSSNERSCVTLLLFLNYIFLNRILNTILIGVLLIACVKYIDIIW